MTALGDGKVHKLGKEHNGAWAHEETQAKTEMK